MMSIPIITNIALKTLNSESIVVYPKMGLVLEVSAGAIHTGRHSVLREVVDHMRYR